MTQRSSEPAPGDSAALARRVAPDLVSVGVERPITVDQTNRSVVVDEALVVKWFRPSQPEPHRGTDVLAHLAAVGFEAMPTFHGTEVIDGHVVASVASFLPGATDGWEWYCGEVSAWLAGSLPESILADRARAMGSLTGRMHVALATPSARWPSPVEEVDVRALHVRALALYEQARAVTTGPTATRLARRWTRIREVIDALFDDRVTAAITIHGDLHVGNVLASGRNLFVIDFDGNPIAPDTGRHPAAADVASLLQSIDHVGRIVDRRTAGAHRDRLQQWIDESATAALGAYRAELARAGLAHLLDDAIVGPLRVVQELHELAYAATHLPHWVYVPDLALSAMFPANAGED